MTAYQEISDLIDDLRRENLVSLSEPLAQAHEGIFNGTELHMKWRFHVIAVLGDPRLTAATRARAEALNRKLDTELR
jgi:hypothetical protein